MNMKFTRTIICACLFAMGILLCGTQTAKAAENGGTNQETTEKEALNDESRQLRIGYCEGEAYYEFDEQLYYLLRGMEEEGLLEGIIDSKAINENSSSKVIWNYVCKLDQSGWKVSMEPDSFINLSDAEYLEKKETQLTEELRQKLKNQQIDLMITMGTTAGLVCKELTPDVEVMNYMAADPLNAGIIQDTNTSGVEGMWAHLDPDAFSRTLEIMNDILMPRKVGIVYADNEEAYIYSGASYVEEFCEKHNIAMERYYVDDDINEEEYGTYVQNMIKASENLAEKADVYLMTSSLLREKDYEKVLAPLYDKKIPVYSLNSTEDVRYGAMMAAESSDYENIGRFGANVMVEYTRGTPLKELEQVYKTAPSLYINYKAARRIRHCFDFTILRSANIVG